MAGGSESLKKTIYAIALIAFLAGVLSPWIEDYFPFFVVDDGSNKKFYKDVSIKLTDAQITQKDLTIRYEVINNSKREVAFVYIDHTIKGHKEIDVHPEFHVAYENTKLYAYSHFRACFDGFRPESDDFPIAIPVIVLKDGEIYKGEIIRSLDEVKTQEGESIFINGINYNNVEDVVVILGVTTTSQNRPQAFLPDNKNQLFVKQCMKASDAANLTISNSLFLKK